MAPAEPAITSGLIAITFDFGNTLVPVSRDGLRAVVWKATGAIADQCGPFEHERLADAWAEERERQFAEDVPAMREVDLAVRIARVLARMRGMDRPGPGARWDDTAAAAMSDPEEISWAVEAYSGAFVDTIPAPVEVGPLLERLAGCYRLGICSNWPLALTIDRFVESAGWAAHLRAIVVSQRVGSIKPDGRIFRAAEEALGAPAQAILHVGDDWAADVVGAKRAGWRAGYLRALAVPSSLPGSSRTDEVSPDLEIDRLLDLEAHLGVGPS